MSYIVGWQPVAFWTLIGAAAAAEVFLSLLEERWGPDPRLSAKLSVRAHQACAGLRQHARRFPIGVPAAFLWGGLEAWLGGRERRALRLWRRAIDAAERLRMPYERACAHLEIGRHLPVGEGDRRSQLELAARLFERLGAVRDLARTRAELAGGRA